MDYCTPQSARRHNPVDSIQRKLQTIQRHSERESNSPFQIPKFSSSSYDSPQSGLRHNLEAILKKRTVHDIDGERGRGRGRGTGMLTATDYRRNSLDSSVPPSTPSDPFTPTPNRPTAANITYTITSTLGERRDAGGTGQGKAWQRYCSTPAGQTKDSSRFTFARGSQFTQPDVERQGGSPPLPRARSQSHGILSYNLNFCSTDSGNPLECELPYPALVVKRLSMGEGGSTMTSESRKETLAEVSLICEEDLLDTIFHVCDTQRRGKVYVSRIVDYLRHTTSRSSEDSGLEDLCNMLDPEHKDVSIDLDTYHAIMKEWIEDCRNNGDEDTADDLTQDSVKLRDSLSAKRSMLLNMTSGSLEAFGGDASRADLETSELVYCVADLQMSNHKLQEEVRRLKQVVEGMEDGNQKLAEENEELRNQARSSQQLALKEKLLKEEVEEMKMTLSFTEESRARASTHSKNMERENQNLIAKIASLQEENFKVTMETDELQRRLRELCDINADLQEEAEEVLIAHSQPVCVGYQVKDARSDPTHSENNNVENLQTAESLPASARNLSSSPEQDRTVTPGNTPPRLAKMVPPNSTSPGPDETITQNGSPRPTSEDHRGGGERGGEANTPTSDMSFAKSLSQDQLAGRAAAEDSTSLLPVLLEEEEGVQDPPPVVVSMAGTDRIADSSSPQSVTGSTVTRTNQSRAGVEGPSQSADSALGAPSGKNKKELELSRAMEAIEEHKAHEDPREAGVTTAKQETSIISDTNDSFREDPSSQQSDKEIETEFQRLSLGFKCDMFTLEKRLRLEERSRDLAEENVRKEVSSCQGLLQALIPLCEEDNQSMEIIHRLQKNLDILIQSMTRVSSRSEMLGAIHQESRIGKAVEVMIQHVENLRRMYTKEHTELLELRETLTQNERSFGSQTEKDDFRGKKQPASQYYKTSTRRVSIAAIPRSGGSNMHFDMPKDGSDAEMERLTRRSPWNVPGKSMVRPPLKRFVSSGAWVDAEDPSLMMKGMAYESDSQSEDDRREEPLIQRRKSSLSELGNMLTSLILPLKTRQDELFVMLPSPSPSPTSPDPMTGPALSHSYSASARPSTAVVARGSRGVWLWLAIVVVLAGLLALLAGLVMQPAVDAAPVGTGDSWMTIQQLLWPYTGLRHNGQPPV
ncbi:inositol 1,4,5-triphosphate receptor associated 2 [Polymixia lowei]